MQRNDQDGQGKKRLSGDKEELDKGKEHLTEK